MTRQTTRRKVLAILAAGAVLGVGAVGVLAAWNDSEFAKGTFSAGSFDLEGSTDGTTYAQHTTAAGAATVAFTSGFDNLEPGSVVYAPFWVRLNSATTSNASLAAVAPTATGTNAPNVSYAVYAIGPTATCDQTALSGTEVASGTTLSEFTATWQFTATSE